MKTFKRICLEDYVVVDENGNIASVKRGVEYITSSPVDGFVTVFSDFWFSAPVDIFGGEIEFTKE